MNVSQVEMTGRQYHESASSMDNRRFLRASCECYAQVQALPPRLGGINHGLSEDISEGGIKIRTFRQLPVDSNVLVQLSCGSCSDSLKVVGSVVWASRADDQDQWVIGISFSDINDRARTQLMELSYPVSIDNDE